MRWAQMAFALAALPLGCYGASVDDDDSCTPGTQIACTCEDGSRTMLVCNPDGTFAACPCGSGGASSGGTTSTGKGGASSSGGTVSTGGMVSTGGAVSTGGMSGSSTGGIVGTAGVGTAGTINVGGAPACNPVPGPVQGDGLDLTIDAIDDTDIMFAAAGVSMGAWDFSKDISTGTITPAGTASLVPEAGGVSGNAFHITGSGLNGWGAAIGAFLNGPTSSFDASLYGGIAFSIKGTSTVVEGSSKVMVMARMPDVLPGPGSCCNDTVAGLECYSAHRTIVDFSTDWTEVTLFWPSFVAPTWGLGSTLAFNPNRVRDITFIFNHDAVTQMPADGATFDVWIDDLRFVPAN